MHYKNGREAKNGDKVVLLRATTFDQNGKPTGYTPIVGILYDAVAGNDHCNGRLAEMRGNSDPCPDLKDCLHLDDVLAAIGDDISKVPVVSK